jgi:hypothetical protein
MKFGKFEITKETFRTFLEYDLKANEDGLNGSKFDIEVLEIDDQTPNDLQDAQAAAYCHTFAIMATKAALDDIDAVWEKYRPKE